MFLILLFFAFFGVVITLLDIPFKRKIKRSSSVEESLKARRNLSRFRRFWAPFLIVAFCVVIIIVDVKNGGMDRMGRHIGMIIALAIIEGIIPRLRGNVQANSKDDYLAKYKDKGYVLYLRAFESDFYSKDPKAHSFEGDLIKALEKYGKNVCAIGMTKELDAPYGATRVYVSDESWQSDVKELMQHAENIFILVSDRQSCIWEISQSAEMLRKTCFIIDSESKFANIKNGLRESIHFPEFDVLLQKLADRREVWEQGKQDSATELNEQLNQGTIKLGLMMHDDGFDVVRVDDMVAFIEDVVDIQKPLNSAEATKPSDKVIKDLKKKKRWFRIAMVSLVVLLVAVLVIGRCFDVMFPEWMGFAFAIPLGALIAWRWFYW